MIRTGVCDLFGIDHPVVLGGMPTAFNTVELAGAVSNAGGLGIIGATFLSPDKVTNLAAALRRCTDRPFGLNTLMFLDDRDGYSAACAAEPAVISLAWPRPDQDLKAWVDEAHGSGAKVCVMAAEVGDAVRAVEAGADVVVAQGTEGGGHVGLMAMSVLVPMVVDAVSPVPVLAAGGVADGRGLAASLALGADGVLVGTRFLATVESGLHPAHKQAILDSDGHDTVLTEVPDVAGGHVWPGAMSRVRRNAFIDRWTGREWALRRQLDDVAVRVREARQAGDVDEAPLFFGQDAGLIDGVVPAGDLVKMMVDGAEEIIKNLAGS